MKILVVSHYFPPEIGAPQARLGDLTRMWAEDGEDVTVLTCMPNHPTGVVPPAFRGKRRLVETHDGVRVVRTWVYATPNEGFARKILGHLSFTISSIVLGWRHVGRPDVVVVSSPTFFSIFSAWLLARGKRSHLVVEVRDLWPAIFVELGVLRNRTVIRILERLELAAYHAAALVVVVTDGFRLDLLRRGIPAQKVVTIPNGVDVQRFDVLVDGDVRRTWRDRLGAADREVLVLYAGAHGLSHGLDIVLETAAHVGPGIRFALVGEGATKAALVARASERNLTNVVFRDGISSTEMPSLLQAADICLVPLRGDVPLFSTFIPSKMFELFAARRAVVGTVRGEPADILRAAGALVVEPGRADQLTTAVEALASAPELRTTMGDTAHDFVAEHYDRRQLASSYRVALAKVVG